MFEIKFDHLLTLCSLNLFELPEKSMFFFGLRGALPSDENKHTFSSSHIISLEDINYTNPRCCILQCKPDRREFAVFPGSTVPHKKYIQQALLSNGTGANQLMSGFYKDYRKGMHKPSSDTGHEAFRQTEGRPIRRTADDLDYQNDDRVEFMNPNNNLHAAWCQSINSESYASAGCQVIVGYPRCKKYGSRPDTGPWKAFKENAYSIRQASFPYVLLHARDAYRVFLNKGEVVDGRLRFGSFGEKVSQLQNKLKQKGFYEGKIDKDFGRRTLNAILEYQTSVFGPSEDDGIIGPNTADALGLTLHKIKC